MLKTLTNFIMTFLAALLGAYVSVLFLGNQNSLSEFTRPINPREDMFEWQFRAPFAGSMSVIIDIEGAAGIGTGYPDVDLRYELLTVKSDNERKVQCEFTPDFGLNLGNKREIRKACGPFEVARDEFVKVQGEFKNANQFDTAVVKYDRIDPRCPIKWLPGCG